MGEGRLQRPMGGDLTPVAARECVQAASDESEGLDARRSSTSTTQSSSSSQPPSEPRLGLGKEFGKEFGKNLIAIVWIAKTATV